VLCCAVLCCAVLCCAVLIERQQAAKAIWLLPQQAGRQPWSVESWLLYPALFVAVLCCVATWCVLPCCAFPKNTFFVCCTVSHMLRCLLYSWTCYSPNTGKCYLRSLTECDAESQQHRQKVLNVTLQGNHLLLGAAAHRHASKAPDRGHMQSALQC